MEINYPLLRRKNDWSFVENIKLVDEDSPIYFTKENIDNLSVSFDSKTSTLNISIKRKI